MAFCTSHGSSLGAATQVDIKPTEAFLRLKVQELKEVCAAGGLSRQGRKADLQQRILTAVRHSPGAPQSPMAARGRVQQALERLLHNHVPFASASAPAALHHGGSLAPVPPRGDNVGTERLRCPCGAHGKCNPQAPGARLVRCVSCAAYVHAACLGLQSEPPPGFLHNKYAIR